MTRPSADDPARTEFVWPEPLVIDIVCDQYRDVASFADRMTIARLQSDALRQLLEGRDRRAMSRRLELIVYCAARGLEAERIAAADRAVFLELTRMVASRFRFSPRSRAALGEVLQGALGRLAKAAAAAPPRTIARSPITARAA